jgi:hypothetical protein
MGRMWGSIAKTIVGLGLLGTMCGCAAPLQPKTFATNMTLTKTLALKNHDLTGKHIEPATARKAVADALILAGDKPTEYTEPFFAGTTNRTWGVRSKASDSSITVEYIDGFRLNTGYSAPIYNQSREVSQFSLSLKEAGDNYEMTLAFPSTVEMVPNDPGPFNPINEYYLPESKIVPNLLTKFNALSDDWVAFALDPNVRGEVTLEYGVDAVRSNFERKFQKAASESESESTRTYYFPTQRETLQLEVNIFPYRNGCKMKYSVPLLHPLKQEEVADIKRQVESVAKD